MKCVIVGDAPYASAYIASLKKSAGPNVIFPGYVFGDGYWELNSNAIAYAYVSSASGTHPALLEAMACGNCVIANDAPTNLEVIGDAALTYSGAQGADDLRRQLRIVLADSDLRAAYGRRARQRVTEHYTWERVTDAYEELFARLAPSRGRRRRQ